MYSNCLTGVILAYSKVLKAFELKDGRCCVG